VRPLPPAQAREPVLHPPLALVSYQLFSPFGRLCCLGALPRLQEPDVRVAKEPRRLQGGEQDEARVHSENPCAKKELLHAKISGTNSALAQPMAMAPPPQAAMPPQPFPAPFDHQTFLRPGAPAGADAAAAAQHQLFQQQAQYQSQLYAPQYPPPPPLYQQPPYQQLMYGQLQPHTGRGLPMSSEAVARDRMQRLKKAVMDKGTFTANQAPTTCATFRPFKGRAHRPIKREQSPT
jgi:hypothetical protein